MKKLLLTLIGCLICLIGNSQNLYLIGAGVKGSDGVSQSWALGTNQMTNDGNGTWTWTGQELKNEFKINDGSWSGSYNIGSNGSNLTLGTTYNASNSGSSGNINFGGGITSVTNPTVTLKISGSTYQITVTGGEDSSVVISLAGSFNANNQNDTKYELTESASQIFTGTFNFAAANPLKFQVIVNHSSWLGYDSSEGATVAFSGSTPVTKKLASGYENDFTVNNWPGGDITFTVNYSTQTVTMVANTSAEVVYPDKLYLIGQANGNDWNENEGVEQSGTDGIFEFKNITISDGGAGTGSFAFTTTLGSWTAINSGRYAPIEQDKLISAGETQNMEAGQDRSWVIAAGTYDFTVDLPKMQLTVTEATPTPPEPELTQQEVTFNLTDIAYLQAYNSSIPAFNNWTADTGDNRYYSVSELTNGQIKVELTGGTSASNKPRMYGTNSAIDLRIYNTNNITISAPEGSILKSVNFNCTNSTATNINKITLSAGQPGSLNTASSSEKFKLWTADDNTNVNTISFAITGTIRVADITVVVMLEEENPEINPTRTLYIVGNDINGEDYSSTTGDSNVMTFNANENTYTWQGTSLGGQFYFNDGSDIYVRIGATSAENATITAGETLSISTKSDINFLIKTDYEIQNPVVTLSLENNTLKVEGNEVSTNPSPIYPDKLYLIGNTWAYNDELLNSWDPANPIEFTSTQEGVFTLEGVELKNDGTSWFSFLNATGSWDDLKAAGLPYRYGYLNDAQVTVDVNTQFQLLENLDEENTFKIEDGVYDFTVDFLTGYFKVTESDVEPFVPEITVPENLYIIGDLFENSWNTASAPALTNNEDGTFSMENVVFAPGEDQEICYFTLSNIQSDNWDDINSGIGLHRYGPETANQMVTLAPETTTLNYTTGYSWSINPGTYNFTVDFNNKVMTITEVIETMEVPDNLYFIGDVYAFNGQPVDSNENWNPETALEFTSTEEGIFTLTGVELKADGNDPAMFNFINAKGTWDEIHALDKWCYGFVEDAEVAVDAATSFQLLESNETAGSFKIAAPAVYDFTVNFNTGEFTATLSDVEPYVPAPFEPGDAISFIGSFDADQDGVWGQGITLEKNEEGLYSGTFELKATDSPIEFQINCGEGYIYGAAQDEETVTLSGETPVELEMVYDSTPWTLSNWEGGFITVTVDWETKTLTMVTVAEETQTPEEFFVYVYNGVEWENVYLYIEDLEGYDVKPGVTTEVTKELYGNNYLVFSVETLNGAEESLLFSNGDDEELEALTYWFESDLYVELTPEGIVIIADPENFKPTSGVKSLYQYLDNETIYTLQGVKVDSNKLTKGIYIINGKKVMLK